MNNSKHTTPRKPTQAKSTMPPRPATFGELVEFTPVFDHVAQAFQRHDDQGRRKPTTQGLIEALVFGLVWRRCQGSERTCFESIPSMAKAIGISDHSVRRALRRLVDAGYLYRGNLRNVRMGDQVVRIPEYRISPAHDLTGSRTPYQRVTHPPDIESPTPLTESHPKIQDRRYKIEERTLVVAEQTAPEPDPKTDARPIKNDRSIDGPDPKIVAMIDQVPGLVPTRTLLKAIVHHPETCRANLQFAIDHPDTAPGTVARMCQINRRLVKVKPTKVRQGRKRSRSTPPLCRGCGQIEEYCQCEDGGDGIG